MKLAEALILRADCQKKIEQLRIRLINNARVQEEETPSENPKELLRELETKINELTNLIKQINKTNSLTILENNLTITDALAVRDTLALKKSVYNALMENAGFRNDRYSRSEIKSFSTVNISELQKQIDRMARDYRELDTKIQQANWNVELITD